jgi:hypothetical protein
LKTGERTHVTLVFFNRLRPVNEQELVMSMAEEYFPPSPHATCREA